MSDARRAADLRLANGEITLDEHTAIVAALSSSIQREAADPSPEVAPALSATNIPTDSQIGGWMGGGLVCGLIWAAIIYVRSSNLEACRANPRMIASSCHLETGGGLVAGLFFVAAALCFLVSYAAYKEQQKALSKP